MAEDMGGFDSQYLTYTESSPGATDLENVQDAVKDVMNKVAKEYYEQRNARLIITGGAEHGYHASGEYGHEGGWKLDIATSEEGGAAVDSELLGKLFDQYGVAAAQEDGAHFDCAFGPTKAGYGTNYITETQEGQVASGAAPNPKYDLEMMDTNLTFKETLKDRASTDMIIIHHTGGATDDDQSAQQIHEEHVKKWAGIGYHFVIRKSGVIENGRPVEKIGAHCQGFNDTSVGIHLCGNFNIGVPTDKQVESCEKLLAYLCKTKYDIPCDRDHIFGHREKNTDTECPGNNLYDKLSDIVSAANQMDPSEWKVNEHGKKNGKSGPNNGTVKGFKIIPVGSSQVKLIKLPEGKCFAEPIYPDYVTVSDTVPKWVLDKTIEKKNDDKAVEKGEKIKDGEESNPTGPNGMHISDNDIQYLMDHNEGMTREQAIEVLKKDKKYTQKVKKNDDGTYTVVEEEKSNENGSSDISNSSSDENSNSGDSGSSTSTSEEGSSDAGSDSPSSGTTDSGSTDSGSTDHSNEDPYESPDVGMDTAKMMYNSTQRANRIAYYKQRMHELVPDMSQAQNLYFQAIGNANLEYAKQTGNSPLSSTEIRVLIRQGKFAELNSKLSPYSTNGVLTEAYQFYRSRLEKIDSYESQVGKEAAEKYPYQYADS